ncbi:MAG: MBL fold metallo-hydrolase [Myroides sp.]|jgi:glyoxylase-like metal-dependent hydrolase (beta-lactamase superfamily II)|nr:MBL fold metallo-hydrolase [Myroides sp.]
MIVNKHFVTLFFIQVTMLLINVGVRAQYSYYTIKVGDIKVTALSDGSVDIDVKQLFEPKDGNTAEQLVKKEYLQNPVEVSINTYLIQDGKKNILVDTGAGDIFGSNAGSLLKSLNAYGLKPSEITDILITHIHADHTGGLVVNDKMVFPNATLHVNEQELNFWFKEVVLSDEQDTNKGADAKTYENARNMMTPYIKANKVKTFKGDNVELLSNIKALCFAGHTPGHTVYVLQSKGELMYFWGDLVHVASVQFLDPFMTDHFDVEQEEAKQTRYTFYEKVVKQQALIGASHISFPGIGRLQKTQQSYKWIAVPFSVKGRTK